MPLLVCVSVYVNVGGGFSWYVSMHVDILPVYLYEVCLHVKVSLLVDGDILKCRILRYSEASFCTDTRASVMC